MKNLLISNLNEKDVDHFTSDIGLMLRKKFDGPFKKACNIFTGANIVDVRNNDFSNDDDYFAYLAKHSEIVPLSNYPLVDGKNNIVIERYPELDKDEPYIFVCNHTCPEDIETILNVIDRNAYLVLGSIETLQYNPEAYLSWLNGMVCFDIMDQQQRSDLIPKMERILKTNSILIFPEGSHNYDPNKIVNKLFDGPVNLSVQTGRKIVVCTLIKDHENNVSYVDVGHPIDLEDFHVEKDYSLDEHEREKKYVQTLTSFIRDKMVSGVYPMMERHFDQIKRSEHDDLEEELRQEKVRDSFEKMKWNKDIFDAEFLTKKTKEDLEYEEVVTTISNLRFNEDVLRNTLLDTRQSVILKRDLDRKNIPLVMRTHLEEIQSEKPNVKKR